MYWFLALHTALIHAYFFFEQPSHISRHLLSGTQSGKPVNSIKQVAMDIQKGRVTVYYCNVAIEKVDFSEINRYAQIYAKM